VARLDDLADSSVFALDVAATIRALRHIPTQGAPSAGGRARPARENDQGVRQAIAGAVDLVDSKAASAIWEEALEAAPHDEALVWVHGDLDQNCLVENGRLSGLIDWSCAGVGDPAADVAVVWSGLFTSDSRTAFLEALDVDAATLARSRGAALAQACAALPYYLNTYPLMVQRCWQRLSTLGVPPRR
jgi:aminoglycoside phosphotransferase (APT) family kinase protein